MQLDLILALPACNSKSLSRVSHSRCSVSPLESGTRRYTACRRPIPHLEMHLAQCICSWCLNGFPFEEDVVVVGLERQGVVATASGSPHTYARALSDVMR